MWSQPFQPKGPTYLVTTTAVQVSTSDNTPAAGYRVRNLSTVSAGYIAWYPPIAVGAPTITSIPPSVLTSAPNTIGIVAGAVEKFVLPPNAWLQASAGAQFEVTPGEGGD